MLSQQQIFFSVPSPQGLLDFLKINAEKHSDHFRFFNTHYKQAVFRNSIKSFISDLEPHYHESKKHYITRKMDYNKFVTIIRQICNSNNITYTKKMIYNNSSYEIVYYIYIKDGVDDTVVDVSDNKQTN
jgi:hypothetical protein